MKRQCCSNINTGNAGMMSYKSVHVHISKIHVKLTTHNIGVQFVPQDLSVSDALQQKEKKLFKLSLNYFLQLKFRLNLMVQNCSPIRQFVKIL